jgi:hypothetical protein
MLVYVSIATVGVLKIGVFKAGVRFNGDRNNGGQYMHQGTRCVLSNVPGQTFPPIQTLVTHFNGISGINRSRDTF